DRRHYGRIDPEQPRLPADPLILSARGMGEDRLGGGIDRGPVVMDRVERARSGEAFELASVEQPRVDPRREILEALERAVGLAFGDERLHRFLADAFERPERVADRAVLDGEKSVASV